MPDRLRDVMDAVAAEVGSVAEGCPLVDLVLNGHATVWSTYKQWIQVTLTAILTGLFAVVVATVCGVNGLREQIY
jgi:hypothetical protein